LHYIKIFSITSLLAVSIMFNLVDTTASDNHGLPKISVSKDYEPKLTTVSYNDLGSMIASWYGPRFHGKLTANGEIYDQMAFTAAHKSLPFGTVLQVSNQKNGRSILVRINDRGPYINGRDLDLSKGSAKAIGVFGKGIARVKVKEIVLNAGDSPVNTLN
jgi:rare lipoprotein A